MATDIQVARAIDAIPIVASTADRAIQYASPATNQRVHNLGTGFVERWTGSAWVTDFATNIKPVFNVQAAPYNAKGDGVTDDQPAIQAAITAAFNAGGGTVYFPRGTYLLQTVQGGNKVFLYPRTGVSFRGEGPISILKAANGLNTAQANDGFSFIRHVVADEGIARVDDMVVSDLQFDHNGLNNLLPNGFTTKPNIAVGVEVGKNIRVHRCTFTNNAGQQTLSFGNNTNPAKVEQLVIENNIFREMGGSVVGNTFATDHSSIYAQALGAIIGFNEFINSGAGFNNTAIECHLTDGVVNGNVVINYSRFSNVVATVTDHLRTTYSNNVARGLTTAFAFWQSSSFVMREIKVTGNEMEQTSGATVVTQAFVDISTSVTNALQSVSITNNIFESLQATANANTPAGLVIGKISRLDIAGNTFRGFCGRAIEFATVDVTMRLVIDNNDIVDCGTTSTSANQHGIGLFGVVTVPYLQISRNRVHNIAATYMTTGVTGNAPVTVGRIMDNETTGITTPVSWGITTNTNFVLSHTGASAPAFTGFTQGSRWYRTDGGASTTFYLKETNAASATWRAV